MEERTKRKQKNLTRQITFWALCAIIIAVVTFLIVSLIKNNPISPDVEAGEENSEVYDDSDFDWDAWNKELEKLRQES